MKTLIRTLAVFGMLAAVGRAQVVDAYWDFQPNGVAAALPSNITGGTFVGMNEYPLNNPGFNSSQQSGGYTGVNGAASGNHNANIAIMGGALDPATSTYFEFTLAPTAGLQLQATSFELGTRSNGPGPTTLTLLASTDGFATYSTLGSPMTVAADSSWRLIVFSGVSYTAPVDTPVTFRLFGTDGIGGDNNANWRIDDVTLGVVAVPEPPTYAAMLVGVTLLGLRAWRRRKSPAS